MEYYGKELLLKFIDSQNDSYEAIYKAVNSYAFQYKNSIFRKETLQNGFLEKDETEISLKFADCVIIVNDKISFDLVVEATFFTNYKDKSDYENDDESIWLRLKCSMIVTDKLEKFQVCETDEYLRKNYEKDKHQATASLVPIISHDQYDSEAEELLKKYYPKALNSPMPIPIESIANQMGLMIIKNKLLTAEHSIFGQICFIDGQIKIYNQEKNQYENIDVNRGTIFIDPQTYFLRNVGCANNTIAHEVFHWVRHRQYATIKSLISKKSIIAQRCPTYQNCKQENLNEEDWLEIQANAIAPKILMPKNMTEQKINELIKKYNYIPNGENLENLKQIIDELAIFFEVSKQASKIRMIELGYEEASKIYNFGSETDICLNEINAINAFAQYNENNDFKNLFDLNLFCFVDNMVVINNPKYIQLTDKGLALTDYAKNNLHECILEFKQNIEIIYIYNRINGVLCREIKGLSNLTKYVSSSHNEAVIDTALAVHKFDEEQEHTKDLTLQMTVAQCIAQLMEKRKWNSSIFAEKTELGPNFYSKIKNHPNTKIEIRPLVSICIGLGYSKRVSKLLLERAGYSLRMNILQEKAYDFILTFFAGQEISSCNEFLCEVARKNDCQIEFLGAKEYANTKVN